MEKNAEWVTIKQASMMIGRSVSTVKRIIKKHGLREKKEKIKGRTVNYIDRYELLNVMANDSSHSSTVNQVHELGHDSGHERVMSHDQTRYLNHLESLVSKLDAEIKELKESNLRLQEENKRLNEEMKALLRDARQKPKGIMGYLMERITH